MPLQVSVSGALDPVKKPYGYTAQADTAVNGLALLVKIFAAQVGDGNPTDSAITDEYSAGDLGTIVYGSVAGTKQYQAAAMYLRNGSKKKKTVNFRSLSHDTMNTVGDKPDITHAMLTGIRDAIRTATGDATWVIKDARWK